MESIVKVEHLSHRYTVDWAIQDINFEVNRKGILGLLGSNGAGKSTLLKMITGELESDTGSITLAKDATLGYLAQYQNIEGEETVYQTV